MLVDFLDREILLDFQRIKDCDGGVGEAEPVIRILFNIYLY